MIVNSQSRVAKRAEDISVWTGESNLGDGRSGRANSAVDTVLGWLMEWFEPSTGNGFMVLNDPCLLDLPIAE